MARFAPSTLRGVLLLLMVVSLTANGGAVEGPLMAPPPRSSTNGAIHYQRAVLFYTAIDPAKRELLKQPVWETVTPQSDSAALNRVNDLLLEGRHAIRSAVIGARQNSADFGLDVGQYLLASYVPHVDAMTDLGRLVTLDAMRQQAAGEWRLAATRLLAAVSMGRDMASQPTLGEALAAVEILETAYFGLGQWAVRCPDTELVSEVFQIVNAMSGDMVNPARPMYFEASIAKMRSEAIQEAFPEGPWAEMLLDSLGEPLPNANDEEMRKSAIAAAVARGVPASAFDSRDAFIDFSSKVQGTLVDLCTASAGCLTLSPRASILRAEKVVSEYQSGVLQLDRVRALNPTKTAPYFAVHRAELDLLRLVLAAAAEKTANGFPKSLDALADRFGGDVPTSPYDGKPFAYTAEGTGLSITAAAAQVGQTDLPEVRFEYAPK